MIVVIFLCCLGMDLLTDNSILSNGLDSFALLSGMKVDFRLLPMIFFLDCDYVFFVFIEGVKKVLLGSDEVFRDFCRFKKAGFLFFNDF